MHQPSAALQQEKEPNRRKISQGKEKNKKKIGTIIIKKKKNDDLE